MNPKQTLLQKIMVRMRNRSDAIAADALRRTFSSCGSNVSIQMPVVINGADHVSIANNVSINAFVHIWGQGGVEIGEHSLIASHVCITSLTHSKSSRQYSDSLQMGPVKIGRNVWIGAHAVILPGITIGDNAIIGAGAVVNRDVEQGDVVAGVPAVSIRRDAEGRST